MIFTGRAWRFGDNIDTDAIIGARHLVRPDKAYLAAHLFENICPSFANNVQRGDVVVAGSSFGAGSSREHAVVALGAAGVGAIIAHSFARNFYRNAVNNGLPALEVSDVCAAVGNGEMLRVDLANGAVMNLDTGAIMQAKPLPTFLAEIVVAGGLIPWLRENQGWRLPLDDDAAAATSPNQTIGGV